MSPGCDHCYAARLTSGRLKHRPEYAGLAEGGTFTGVIRLLPDRLDWPLRWRKPRRIFVASMSDLFHDDVPDEYLDEVFGAMAVAHKIHGHEFQVLTKRHARMRSYLTQTLRALPGGYLGSTRRAIAGAAFRWAANRTNAGALADEIEDGNRWPLPGVWLGVSVESQQWADIRIPALLDTPAAVRWVSAEPLLGPVELWDHLWRVACPSGCGCRYPDHADARECACDGPCCTDEWNPRPALDWVVAGGESGPGARPAHPDWFRDLRDQCQAAGVAYHHKQNGEWQDGSSYAANSNHLDHVIVWDGRHENAVQHGEIATDLALARLRRDPGTERATVIARVGKKAAGRLLDGRTWDEYPDGAR